MVEIKIDLLITAGYLLNPGYDLQLDAAVAIKDQRIVDVGDSQALMARYESETVLSRPHALLMPGLVDAHTHACQQLLRPCTVDELPMVWSRILVPFEACLGPEDVYISAMAACVEMIKAGITCFADAGGPHMGQVAKAVVQTGLRGVLARSTMDTGDFLPEQMRETTRAAVD
ncbi:MAG: amidohydrolase family protein, partial [Bacillota bacterium]